MPVAEVLSVGTELLLGQVLDTNCQFLAVELAKLGIDCFFRTTVGDNKQRIKEALQTAFNRADVVITTGGLGPTADDLTTECLAEFFQVEQVFDDQVWAHIQELFKHRNFPLPESNRKQALRPLGAQILPNPAGTAPGIIWHVSPELLKKASVANPEKDRCVLTFPGVPRELKAMWADTAFAYLLKRYTSGTMWSIELKHYGIGESALAEQYAHLLEGSNPTVAPYAGTGECRLRVTAKADTIDGAKIIAQPIVDEILAGSGQRCYGFDNDTLESVVGELLVKGGYRLSVAESCTGGLLSQRLTDIAGSSRYITLNVVSYAYEAKVGLLGVSPVTLEKYGAVSPECAEEMARGMLKLGYADIALSVTGVAGPAGGTEAKPVGLVYMALVTKDQCIPRTLQLGSKAGRSEIRFRTTNEALNMVRLFLLNNLK
ncbi:MAG: competence/damage-inducible protein A [Candidatus Obscuribacterales bacterium]|nr:competence/damage-inducible protein A [Candidatus Obscuribacterales bacterium]